MAELDLQRLMAEAMQQRSRITTTLLAIQKTLDKMQPMVTKREAVLASLEPAVNELPARRPRVDPAVGKPQADGDILRLLAKIATRSFPSGSSSTMLSSRCSTECLIHADDWVQPMSANNKESNITPVVAVDNNTVDPIAPMPTGGSTSSPAANTAVIPTASDAEDVREVALPATSVYSATAHNTCSISGLGPVTGIKAPEVPLSVAVVLPIDPWFLKSLSPVRCNLPAAMTEVDSTTMLKLLPTLEYPCDTSPSLAVTVRILSSDVTGYEFLTLPWDPGQRAIDLTPLIHAQGYDANKAKFVPAVQVLGWDLISGFHHEKPWDPWTSLLTAPSHITHMIGSMQYNFHLPPPYYFQCVQQTSAVVEASLCWECHRIWIIRHGTVPSSLMADLLQENLTEKPKYNVHITSSEGEYKQLHTSFLPWRTSVVRVSLCCSAQFQWKVAWLFYHLTKCCPVALLCLPMRANYFTKVWVYAVQKGGLIIRLSTNLYCRNTTKSEGMQEFLTIGIQLTYICQAVCLYGEILEKTAASAEEFSINKASFQLHKKKKECMAREIYMGVISADFQGSLLLIKAIWVWSLYLAGSATKIKQDVTCNMVCRQLRQFGLFVLHLKNGVSCCSCHYTAGGDTWYGCELDLVNLQDSKVMLVELSSWNCELVTRAVQPRPSWESHSLEKLSTLLYSATSDNENTEVQVSMMLMHTSVQWHYLRKEEFEGSENSSRDGLMVPQLANGIQGSKLRSSNQGSAFHQWSAHCLLSGAKWLWQKEIAHPCYVVREHWQLHTDLGSAHKRRVRPNAAESKGFKRKIWLGFGIPLVKSNLTGNKRLMFSTNPVKDLRLLRPEHHIPILSMSSHQLPCDMKIVEISLKLIQVGVIPLLGSNSHSGRHLEQLWDPGGNTSSVWLYQGILTGGRHSVDAIEFPSSCEAAPCQGERRTMVPAFVTHHYYITAILDKVHFVHAYYEVPVGTGHNILKDYLDFDQVCINKDYYLDTPGSSASFTSTSTIATFVKATTTNLAAPWDPGRNLSAPAWGQAEFQGVRNVTGTTTILHQALQMKPKDDPLGPSGGRSPIHRTGDDWVR